MKNIYILPADSPSRLYFNTMDKKYQLCEFPKYNTDIKSTHNIYITSDEEIKEGNWFVVELFKITGESDGLHIEKCTKLDDVWCNNFDIISKRHKDNCKKIILTTDQDLIKNGVQPINDEFLKWFVKNPSCKYVKYIYKYKYPYIYNSEGHLPDGTEPKITHIGYEIIIPKEEPIKNHYLDELHNINKNVLSKMCEDIIYGVQPKREMFLMNEHVIIDTRTPKQETLEKAAEKYADKIWDYSNSNEKTLHNNCKKAFSKGAKWQQEQKIMYSEKEVEDLIYKVCGTVAKLQGITLNGNHIDTAYKQFKNK